MFFIDSYSRQILPCYPSQTLTARRMCRSSAMLFRTPLSPLSIFSRLHSTRFKSLCYIVCLCWASVISDRLSELLSSFGCKLLIFGNVCLPSWAVYFYQPSVLWLHRRQLVVLSVFDCRGAMPLTCCHQFILSRSISNISYLSELKVFISIQSDYFWLCCAIFIVDSYVYLGLSCLL